MRPDTDRLLLRLKVAPGQPDFAALWLEGRLSSVEQALNLIAPTPPEQDQHIAEKLTAREISVLRLVADGLTNAEVAYRQGISRRTVDAHIRTIYGKLDVSSRSGATRFAVEHHLI